MQISFLLDDVADAILDFAQWSHEEEEILKRRRKHLVHSGSKLLRRNTFQKQKEPWIYGGEEGNGADND